MGNVPPDFYQWGLEEAVALCHVLFNKAVQKLIKRVLLAFCGSRV